MLLRSRWLQGEKNPVVGQIPEENTKAGGGTILSGIHTLINSIWDKEELPEEWEGIDHYTY